MPFDSTGYIPGPPPRKRSNDNVVTILIMVLVTMLLGLPFSMAALIDIVRALRGH